MTAFVGVWSLFWPAVEGRTEYGDTSKWDKRS